MAIALVVLNEPYVGCIYHFRIMLYQLVFYIFSGKIEKFLNIKSTTKCLNEDKNKEENKRKFRK
jgi:hypothetical protein